MHHLQVPAITRATCPRTGRLLPALLAGTRLRQVSWHDQFSNSSAVQLCASSSWSAWGRIRTSSGPSAWLWRVSRQTSSRPTSTRFQGHVRAAVWPTSGTVWWLRASLYVLITRHMRFGLITRVRVAGPPPPPPTQQQSYGPSFEGSDHQQHQLFYQYSQCNGKKKALCVCSSASRRLLRVC